jgi:HK97 family phage portal protein
MASIFDKAKNFFTGKSIQNTFGNLIDDAKLVAKEYFDIFDTYFSSWGLTGRNYLKFLKTYASNPLVYMVVNRISTNVSAIKIKVENDKGDVLEDSLIEKILKSSDSLFIQKTAEFLLLTGNVYIYFEENYGLEGNGQFILLNPAFITIKTDTFGDISGYYNTGVGKKFYEKDEILHIKTSNVLTCDNGNELYGLSPLQAGWIVVQSSNEKLNAEASIFKNRGVIGILTSDTDTPILKQEKEKLQKELDEEMRGSEKFNKIKISATKLRYVQTGMSPSDLKLLEGILTSLRMICALYSMPSVLFNDNESSTYNNIKEAKISAYLDVYIPVCQKILNELSKWVSEKFDTEEKAVPDLTSIEAIKGTTNELGNAINLMPSNVSTKAVEVLTINEFRSTLDLEPLPSGGDVLVATVTLKKTDTNKVN